MKQAVSRVTPHTSNYFYPIFEGRPYTQGFANILSELISVEKRIWQQLQQIQRLKNKALATVNFELLPFGDRSLPNWSFELREELFQGTNHCCNMKVCLSGEVASFHPDAGTPIILSGNWSQRSLSDELSLIMKYFLPYTKKITISTPFDEVVYSINGSHE